MARQINRLSAVQVKTEKKRGLHADGGGLYLQISPFETKSWIFRFSRNKRSRDMGLALQSLALWGIAMGWRKKRQS